MKPSRARDRVAVVGYPVLIVGAVALIVLAEGLTRFAMVLVVLSAAMGLGMAIYRLRHYPY